MVHFSAIAMIHKEKVVPFPDIVRGTFALTNIQTLDDAGNCYELVLILSDSKGTDSSD